jgi:hypothetical protein
MATVLILDVRGVVRGYHIGYSPRPKKERIAKIDRLLGARK